MPKSVDKKQDKRIAKLERIVGEVEEKFNVYANYSVGGLTTIGGVTGAAAPLPFNFINGGSDANDRIGNKVMVKKLFYHADLSTSLDAPQSLRFIVFYWKSKTAPTLADVILATPSAAGIPNLIFSPINPVNVKNGFLQVLRDDHIKIEGDVLGSGTRLHRTKFSKVYKAGKPQYYSDNLGGDMKQGFYYVWLTDNPNATTTCQDAATTYFVDS